MEDATILFNQALLGFLDQHVDQQCPDRISLLVSVCPAEEEPIFQVFVVVLPLRWALGG